MESNLGLPVESSIALTTRPGYSKKTATNSESDSLKQILGEELLCITLAWVITWMATNKDNSYICHWQLQCSYLLSVEP